MRRRGLVFLAFFFAAGLVGGCRDVAKAPQAAVRTAPPAAPVAAEITAPPVIHPLQVDYSAPPGKGTQGRHFSTLQASKLKLSGAEAKLLDANGFVISTTKRFPTFAHRRRLGEDGRLALFPPTSSRRFSRRDEFSFNADGSLR